MVDPISEPTKSPEEIKKSETKHEAQQALERLKNVQEDRFKAEKSILEQDGLLALSGLKREDFRAIISVSKTSGGELVVRTAERVPRSATAIRNNNYLRSWADSNDRGMQVYLFIIPGIEGRPDKTRA